MFIGDILASVKPYVSFPKIWTTNVVFQLHSKVSALLLFTACLCVTAAQFFGDPIDCIVEVVPEGVMDTYCWIHSTFTLPKLLYADVGEEVSNPGVGPVSVEDEIVEHKYYQWVCFTLFLQGCCFVLPYSLWKSWERGTLASLIPQDDLMHRIHDSKMPGFGTSVALIDGKKVNLAVAKMKAYFMDRQDRTHIRTHRHYFLKFTICEVLNFLNVIFQIILLDTFFGGVFTRYGLEVVTLSQTDPEKRFDPLNSVFPKVAKCTFHQYGPSGTIQEVDGLCILSLNIINEKIYIMLWLWFVFLSTVSAMQLVWRILSIISVWMREVTLGQISSRMARDSEVTECCRQLSLGDWFLLAQIGCNIDSHIFAQLIHQVASGLNKIHGKPQAVSQL